MFSEKLLIRDIERKIKLISSFIEVVENKKVNEIDIKTMINAEAWFAQLDILQGLKRDIENNNFDE